LISFFISVVFEFYLKFLFLLACGSSRQLHRSNACVGWNKNIATREWNWRQRSESLDDTRCSLKFLFLSLTVFDREVERDRVFEPAYHGTIFQLILFKMARSVHWFGCSRLVAEALFQFTFNFLKKKLLSSRSVAQSLFQFTFNFFQKKLSQLQISFTIPVWIYFQFFLKKISQL